MGRIFYVQQLFRLKELTKSMVNIAESLCDRVSVRKRIAVKTAFSSILRSSFVILITQEQESWTWTQQKNQIRTGKIETTSTASHSPIRSHLERPQ